MIIPKNVGFIGGGNMGEALIKGLLLSGSVDSSQITVSEISQQRIQHMRQTYQVSIAPDNASLAGEAEVIIIAVKPQQVGEVLHEIKDSLEHLPLIISIAAGVTLAYFEQAIGKPVPVVRVMPNAPALVLAGVSAIAGGTHSETNHLNMARLILEAVGLVVELDEAHMDAVTGLSGSGPAYVFLFMEALIDAGVMVGLSRAVARDLVLHTTLGAAKLLAESETHPGALKDLITSAGGTAIHALAVLETAGIRGILMDAVAAATKRSEELGKK